MESDIHRISADGADVPRRVLARENRQEPESLSPDGRFLAFADHQSGGQRDIWVLNLESETAAPFLTTPANENGAAFSPDGCCLAYVSDVSGRSEVYVQPFPGPGARIQASTDGGTAPVWSPEGDELFYRNQTAMIAVPVRGDEAIELGRPRVLFDGPYQFDNSGHPSYDVSRDGRRFLMIRRDDYPLRELRLVSNWELELPPE